MKNLFTSVALFSILALSITSCSVESLEDQGLQDSEANFNIAKNDTQIEITTLYIEWNNEVTQVDMDNLRQELMNHDSPVILHYFEKLDETQLTEQWEVSIVEGNSKGKKPKKWLNDKKEIGFVSVDPF